MVLSEVIAGMSGTSIVHGGVHMLTILLIIVVVLLLTGGGLGYSRRRRL